MATGKSAVRLAVLITCASLAFSVSVVPDDGEGARGSQPASGLDVAAEADGRTVSYSWYDFFNVPYGEWWDYRSAFYELEYPITDSFPYLNRYYYNFTHSDTFSSARLNITGRDMSELNMSDRPLFLPFLSGPDGPRGGSAVIDWRMQYLTIQDYLDGGYPAPLMAFEDWFDGFVIQLKGAVQLDRDASMAVMNLTLEGFNDFDNWWAGNQSTFTTAYFDWIMDEGNDRLDIYTMYEYNFMPLVFDIYAEKVGDTIVLTYDTLSWGMECLMTRWLHDAFMPTEWWFEDFSMHAEIGPESADLDIDTAVAYAVKAWEAKETGEPCWIWQGMLGDYVMSTITHPFSAFDRYYYLEHLCCSPGSYWNGCMVPYEYTPGCFNLSEGETLSFVWPTEDIVFLGHVGLNTTSNTTGPAIMTYSEPLPSEMPECTNYSIGGRYLEFIGPIDFWTWSKTQDSHEFLSDEWDRMGVLPYGMPYIELSPRGSDTPPVAYFEAELAPWATCASQYLLNASMSYDSEDGLEDLEFRWDLDGDGAMDTEWSSEYTVSHDFGASGTFRVSVSVKDTDNMTDTMSAEVTVAEIDPPVTTLSADGTVGLDDWFVSEVTVNLSAEDESGVVGTYYRMGQGVWFDYVDEFEIGSDGVITLSYYSVDAEGNVEPALDETLKVDTSAPSVNIDGVTPHEEMPGNVDVTWECGDGMSGIDRSEVSLDGGEPVSCAKTSYTYYGLSEGDHTVEVVVYDNAGLHTADSYVFTVAHEDVGPSLAPALLIGIGVVAATIVIVFLIKRRRPPSA